MNNADLVAEGPNNNNNNQNGKEPKKRGLFGTYLKYGFMPGFGERFKRLGLQLGHFAYLLAMVYGAVRLIKPGHPVLNPANIGKFGFRDVISAAAENVIISKQTIDQVLIFGAVLLGIALAILQFFAIFLWVAMDMYGGMAHAQDIGSMFTVPDPSKDLGLIGLEMVFGTELFGTGAPESFLIQPLHAMLAFFSYAMLVIAVFLLIYYVFVVVGEAAISGTPFGRRFNGFYAPIRLCLAFGLLIPVAGGLNVAQYTTLWTAKMGSNMASNAWGVFADTFMDPKNFIITPSGPYLEEFIGAVLVNELCLYAYNTQSISGSSDPMVERRFRKIITETGAARRKLSRVSHTRSLSFTDATAISEAVAAGRDTITLYWTSNTNENSIPNETCGSIRFNIARAAGDNDDGAAAFDSALLNPAILDEIRDSYITAFGQLITIIQNAPPIEGSSEETLMPSIIAALSASGASNTEDFNGLLGDSGVVVSNIMVQAQEAIMEEVEGAVGEIQGEEESPLAQKLKAMGWVAAGANFNIISRLNGQVFDAVHQSLPKQKKPPQIGTGGASVSRWFRGVFGGEEGRRQNAVVREILPIIGQGSAWFEEGISASSNGMTSLEGSGASSVLSKIGEGIVSDTLLGMRADDVSLNPLGQLAIGGKELINNSIMTYTIYVVGLTASAALEAAPSLGKIPAFIAKMLAYIVTPLLSFLVTLGLTAGFILHFMIPMLPFMYFLFAVVGWIGEIFEAIVAMPLWALAHIRIDGDGLSGQAASGGYYLLFMIFIRPTMIVFGLIGAYLSFMVGVFLLSKLFELSVNSIGAHSWIDGIGFTVIYVIIVYNMANSSFKLIDAVPNQILRWMGNSTPTFSDGRDPGFQTMQGVAAYAGTQAAGALASGTRGATSGMMKKMDNEAGGANEIQRNNSATDSKHRRNVEKALGVKKKDRS